MSCPICKKTTVKTHTPFCSKRCADEDLSKWIMGNYTIPVVELDEDDIAAIEGGEGEQN